MRKPRRPHRSPATSPTPPLGALRTVAVLIPILSLTGCAPSDPTPLPTVSPTGASTPVVQPTPFVTTMGPRTGPSAGDPGPTTSSPGPNGQAQWTFIVVRHSNWIDDGSDDPPLTEAGEIRARRLADLLSTRPGVAVYATRFRRAQDTARPTAVLWEVPVTTYNGSLAPTDLLNQIRQRHPAGQILIVGHSHTVPGIVGELCRCRVDPPQNDYANRYEITLGPDNRVLRTEHHPSY